MQGLLRQYCYQSALIQRKARQPNNSQNSGISSHKKSALARKVSLNGLQFRRRMPKTPQKQHPPFSKQILNLQQIQNSHDFQQTKKKSCVIRHNDKATPLKEQRDQVQKVNNYLFLNQKMRARMTSQQAMYPQQFNISKFGWRLRNKLSKTEQHIQMTEKQKQHSDTVKKKIKTLNQTTFHMGRNQEESTFLELLSKFRFQNLKDVVVGQGLKSPLLMTPTKLLQNRQIIIRPFRVYKDQRKHEEKPAQSEINNTTFYHQPQIGQTNQDRRVTNQSKHEFSIINQNNQERNIVIHKNHVRSTVNQNSLERSPNNQIKLERRMANQSKLKKKMTNLSPWQITDCVQIWQ